MPEVTVWPRPNGLPMAMTKSPTWRRSESPNGTAVRLTAGICSTATSVSVSVPISFAVKRRLSLVDDLDAGRVFDDMAVGQDIALRRVDDDARPGCLALVFLRLLVLRQVEKAAEERVLQQRVLLLDPTAHRDVDDPRGDAASIGARLGTRPPPTAGIGAVASAGRGGSAIAATAPINRTADNNRCIVARTLRMVGGAVLKRRAIGTVRHRNNLNRGATPSRST